MTLLAIDTSGPRLQLALLQGEAVFTHREEIAKGHAEILFDRIAALLDEAQLGYADLTGVATVTGPGSFTGLRIGIAAARGLGLAREIPVIGVPTLLAISLSGPAKGPIAVINDARRGEAYVQRFEAPGQATGDTQVLPAEEAHRLAASAALLENAVPDIAAVARFAETVDPALWPPEPHYVRAADAKPQQKARLARSGPPAS